jgi:hypothetical protein
LNGYLAHYSTWKDNMVTEEIIEEAQPLEVSGLPPQAVFTQLVTGYWVSQGLYVAARLGIVEHLKSGPKSSEELAAECEAHAPSLYRLLRMLANCGVFTQDAQGKFSVTPVGQLLQEGPGSFRAMTIHLGEKPTWQAWGNLLDSVRTGETAFPLTHGKEVFPYYAEHPESNEPFNQAMTEYSAAVVAAVMRAYDFSRYSRFVDIGGGHGFLLSAILKANPKATGVLFDIPPTAEEAKAGIEAQGLATRCDVVSGNFFESVPEGGDAYVMKNIIHDWDDERSITILKHINKAIVRDGRVFLIEAVVPEGNTPDFSTLGDIHMMVMTGGCERTAAEYSALFQKSGFGLVRVVRTESAFSVVEAVKL